MDAPPQPRNNTPVPQPWSYSFTTPAGGINALQAVTTQATLAVPYTATLAVALSTGVNLSLPVSGSYQGLVYSPVVRIRSLPECSTISRIMLCQWLCCQATLGVSYTALLNSQASSILG